jgi:plastocyanin
MKKILIILIVAAILGPGYLFIYKNKVQSPDAGYSAIFIDADDVSSDTVVVKITDDGFDPTEVSIRRGGKVVFVNSSGTFAWPASDPHPIHSNYYEFDPQEPMKPGQAWRFTFAKPGTWKFHDHLRPGSRGAVNVSE